METKIDYHGIAKLNIPDKWCDLPCIEDAMKQAVEQALTIILEDVAENATAYYSMSMGNDFVGVDKQSILGRAEELKKKLGITI